MLRYYIITSWRNLKRNKLFSGLNILGLAIGMAGAMLIAIWLQNMLSYDRFHKNENQLYVLSNVHHYSGDIHADKYTPKILGPSILQANPEIENVTRYDYDWPFLFTFGEKVINGKEGAFVDPDFFKMFSFPLLKGSINNDWKNGKGIVLTEKFAETIFGKEDPMGKTLKIDSSDYVTVSGILTDFPPNTMFKNDYFLSWEYAKKIHAVDSNWSNNNVQTFIKLVPGVNITAFNNKIKGFYTQHSPKITSKLFAEPLRRNFLYDEDENGKFATGRIVVVRCIGLIAALLILIACTNFMNLSTAQSEKRARETGVRKVIGASRKSIILQFLTESIMHALIAFLLALMIVIISLPRFDQLIEMPLSIHLNAISGLVIVVSVLLIGLLAGSYPAVYLSSFKPATILKGKLRQLNSKVNARSVLVVLQFSVAIILILTTIMISKDVQYAQHRGMGYRINGLVYSNITGQLGRNYLPLRNQLLQSGAVTSVSKNMSPITERQSSGWGMRWPGSTEEDKKTDFLRFSSDAGMMKTMGMKLIGGRDIDIYKYPADSTGMLLTQGAVRAMHLKSPLGAIVRDNNVDWHVVGVMEDFIIDQPFDNIKPMLVEGPRSWFGTIHYRLNPAKSVADNLSTIRTIFDRYNIGFPFEYNFADASYAKKFEETKKYGQLCFLFAGLAIFISCLGLFGLISFMAEAKTKEIGIRKVLGASVAGIIGLLSKGFLKLIALAFFISIPVALYVMHKWLSTSAYSVNISCWWFVITAILTLTISFITVGFQAFMAAKANPVNSLKSE